jgi:DNA-binding CsgD family transcriptional regulator/tetratricopeptide (TPR) repeat protein
LGDDRLMESARHPLVCPVMVGRDELVDHVDRRLTAARDGAGQLLFLAGEAGIGKTRFLSTVERRAVANGSLVVRASTFPGDLGSAGSSLLDLARALGRAPVLADLGHRLDARLAELDGPGDAHRRRRALVLDLADLLAGAAAPGPILLGLEDLHWADDLTLEVLGTLAGRSRDLPMLVIGTYRSDELYPRVPMREWRARLVTQRLAEELRLRRLQPKETATMVAAITRATGPIAQDIADAIQIRTDGIPLHVEELLGVLTDGGNAALGERDPVATARPADTLGALVRTRLAARSAAAIRVASAASVIGRSFDVALLSAVLGPVAPSLVDVEAPPGADDPELAAAVAELTDYQILVAAVEPGRLAFRHALIGDAIYDGLAEPDRRRWHGRIADAVAARQDLADDAYRSLHLERAGRRTEAFQVACRAARQADRMSAHREALALYERALRTAPADLSPATLAATLQATADEAAAVDHNDLAAATYAQAREAWLAADRPLEAADVVAPLVATRHLLGDDLASRIDALRGALAELNAVPEDDAAPVRARLLAGTAAAYMLARRLDPAIEAGRSARILARNVGDAPTERHAATTLGACFVFAGAGSDGWPLLEDVIASTKAAHLEGDCARAYRMLGSCASVLVEYQRAEHWLREGIAYAERVEHWNHRHYMTAHLAHVLWATGRWDEAQALAARSMADGRGGLTTRITALHVEGYVALGRGDWTRAAAVLGAAVDSGGRMNELQRWSPAAWGLAEAARLQGDLASAARWCDAGLAASAEVDDAAYLFPFVVTGTRLHLARHDQLAASRWLERCAGLLDRRAIPGTMVALVHARGLLALAAGTTRQARRDLLAARAGWLASGRVWEGWWAGLDLAACELRSGRQAAATSAARPVRDQAGTAGAVPLMTVADDLLQRAAERGGRVGGRAPGSVGGAGDAAWAPLTARETSVARLVARGHTNAAVADELGISPRTASSHVEHILTKLEVGRRAEIAAWVATRAVVDSRPHGTDRDE